MSSVIFSMMQVLSLVAACGFASSNIEDTVQNRSNVTSERTALTAKLETQRRDRAAIREARSVDEIRQAIQIAQPSAESVWKATKGCTDVTIKDSLKACASVLALRQAQAEAERRENLNRQITDNEKALAALPAYAEANPAADTASKLLGGLLSAGFIQGLWIGFLTIVPTTGGLLLSFAMMLWRPVRRYQDA